MSRSLPTLVDRDAELSVIGGVLLKPQLLPLLPEVDLFCFTDPNLGHVWAAMRNLDAKGQPIDEITVLDELERGSEGSKAVPPSVVAEAALRVPTADSVEHYAQILLQHRLGRDVAKALDDVSARLRNGSLEGPQALVEAQSQLAKIDTGERDERGRALGDIAKDIVAALCRGDAKPESIKAGLAALDRRTGGIPFGVPTVVLAPPATGKTTLAMAFCEGAEAQGDAPLVYTYEDGWNSFGLRSLARYSGVPTETIRAADFREDEMRRVSRGLIELRKRKTVIVRASGMGVEELVRDVRARRLKHRGEGTTGKLVIVDYIQRMPLPKMDGTKNDRIGEVSKRLADLAANENIAVVVNSQVGRQVPREERPPTLQDARDSGELDADAKLTLGLYRPSVYGKKRTGDDEGQVAPPSVLEIHILKNHNGAAECHVEVHWDLATHHITNVAEDSDGWRYR